MNDTIYGLLYIILYKKKTKKMINNIISMIKILLNTITTIKKNKNFNRVRKLPSTKWNKNGNRFEPKSIKK